MDLKKGSMSVQEHEVKFTQPFKYDPYMISYPRAQMSMLLFGVPNQVKDDNRNAIILRNMDIHRLMDSCSVC